MISIDIYPQDTIENHHRIEKVKSDSFINVAKYDPRSKSQVRVLGRVKWQETVEEAEDRQEININDLITRLKLSILISFASIWATGIQCCKQLH